jgi:hypothetical protein
MQDFFVKSSYGGLCLYYEYYNKLTEKQSFIKAQEIYSFFLCICSHNYLYRLLKYAKPDAELLSILGKKIFKDLSLDDSKKMEKLIADNVKDFDFRGYFEFKDDYTEELKEKIKYVSLIIDNLVSKYPDKEEDIKNKIIVKNEKR